MAAAPVTVIFHVLGLGGLVERTDPHLAASEAQVHRPQGGQRLAVHGHTDRARLRIVFQHHVIPAPGGGEGGGAALTADPHALAAVDMEDAVVNRLLRPGVGGKVRESKCAGSR